MRRHERIQQASRTTIDELVSGATHRVMEMQDNTSRACVHATGMQVVPDATA